MAASFAATVLAFVGTSRALPASLRMRQTQNDEAVLSKTQGRFAHLHTFSTAWQAAAFVALAALAYQR